MQAKKKMILAKNEHRFLFIKKLTDILVNCRIKQKDLALVGEVQPSTINSYMNGKSEPNQSVLTKWASKWNINLNWLLLDEGEMLRNTEKIENSSNLLLKNQDLEAENLQLRQELIESQKEIIELYRQLYKQQNSK